MKKFLTLLLVCLLVCLPVFVLGGCKDTPDTPVDPDDPSIPSDPTDPSDPSNPGDPSNPDDPVTPVEPVDPIIPAEQDFSIIANGAADCRIIMPDVTDATAKASAIAIRNAIQAVTGVKLSIVTDWEDKDNNADIKEILIGATNRTESKLLNDYIGGNEYCVAVSGNKLVIVGGKNEMLTFATEAFLSEYCGYTSEDEYTPAESLTVASDAKLLVTRDTTKNIAMYVANGELSYIDDLYDAVASFSEDLEYFTISADTDEVFDVNNYGLVIIVGAEKLPAESQNSIETYMRNGGRILTLGGPAYEEAYEKDSSEELWTLKLDSFAPMYELYPITNAADMVTCDDQLFVADRDYVLPKEIISCEPGRQGIGYNNARPSRFIPLIEVTDEDGLRSGYAAWIHLFSSTGSYNGVKEGSMFACFSAVSEDFYNEDGIAAIVETLEAMTSNFFLVEGGTDEFCYITEDTDSITAGVSYVALNSARHDNLVVEVSLYNGEKLLKTFSSNYIQITDIRHNIKTISGTYDIANAQPTRVVATLSLDGVVVDRVEHSIRYWEAKPEDERSFIYVEDGAYMKDGEPITFFGANFIPATSMAETQSSLYERWNCRASYDPEVVANDLARIKDVGMNAVSAFVYHEDALSSNNILDFITMCEEMGIYVDLAIRQYLSPVRDNFDIRQADGLIKRMHFDENDNIIAYDIAWEHRIGDLRNNWNADFYEWVKVQYGSLAHAEKLWGVELPVTPDTGLPYVSNEMLDDMTGKYQKANAAYLRFIDDYVSNMVAERMIELQAYAPNQIFSWRMAMAGCGERNNSLSPRNMCFDYQTLAANFNVFEPEGYTVSNNADSMLQILVNNAYGRYTNPDAPIVWKEFGVPIYEYAYVSTPMPYNLNFNPPQARLNGAASYYASFFEHCYAGYTSGLFCWWNMGGYRLGEDSDCGVFNPDGSDRPVTAVLREWAPKFINQGARPEAEVLIQTERDNHGDYIFGIYDEVLDEVREAYANGKFFNFVNELQETFQEKVYADEVYKDAVGGTSKQGTYPLRYVNGLVKQLTTVEKNSKTYAQIVVCNTQHSTWRAGTVSLISTDDSEVELNYTFDKDVDYLENVTIEVPLSGTGELDLRFEIKGVQFGPLYTTTID